MRKISAFNYITLNGYYKGLHGDISWHRHGAQENQYAAEGLRAGNILLFGRVTYQLMAKYWPTPLAMKNNPVVAAGMKRAEKIVFSRTLKKVEWKNTQLIKTNIIAQMKQMKQSAGKDMTILGSGTILTKFAEHGLIDDYQFMVVPVVLAAGTPLFDGLKRKLGLKLTRTKTFDSGVVLLCYQPL